MAHRRSRRRIRLPQADDHVDLVPLIDCIFLILLFFMLCGRLSTDNRTEQISVAPTVTANKFPDPNGWSRYIINVFGSTQGGDPPRNTIWVGKQKFTLNDSMTTEGINNFKAYIALRKLFDAIHDQAEKFPDPSPLITDDSKRVLLPRVIVELRADADTEFRVVQEIQQVLTDSVDPENQMLPKAPDARRKPFVNLEFTTRPATADH